MQITIVDASDGNSDSLFATLQEVVENFEDPFELVRELLSNSADSGASNVWIDFDEDPVTHEIRVSYEDDGEGLRQYLDADGKQHNRLHYFFQLGKSDKRNVPGKIGRKGFGTKIAFLSAKIEVESQFLGDDGALTTVKGVLDKPYDNLVARNSLIAQETKGAQVGLRGKTGTKISLHGFKPNKQQFYESATLIEYIRWFTAGGSVAPIFDSTAHPIRIKVKDTAGTITDFDGVHNPPLDCDPTTLPEALFSTGERRTVDGQDVILRSYKYAKRVAFAPDGLDFVHEGKKVTVKVCAWILGKSKKDEFASDKYLPDRDRFGVWLAQGGILVQRHYSWITSSPLDCNYHVIVNCDQFELNADRTRIKGKNNSLYRTVKDRFEKNFKQQILDAHKAYRALKDQEEREIAFYGIRSENKERVTELSNRDPWPYTAIQLGLQYEPQAEIEVSALLCALAAQHPAKVPFQVLSLFPLGTDAAVRVPDTTTGLFNTTMYEVETVLTNFIKHGHPSALSNGIICWKNDLADGKKVRKLKSGSESAWFRPQGQYLEIYSGEPKLKDLKAGALQPVKRIPVYVLQDVCEELEKTAAGVNAQP